LVGIIFWSFMFGSENNNNTNNNNNILYFSITQNTEASVLERFLSDFSHDMTGTYLSNVFLTTLKGN
jgi:hypothetical protein